MRGYLATDIRRSPTSKVRFAGRGGGGGGRREPLRGRGRDGGGHRRLGAARGRPRSGASPPGRNAARPRGGREQRAGRRGPSPRAMPTAALAAAALVVGDRFRFHRHAGVTIENRACLAEWDAGAQSTDPVVLDPGAGPRAGPAGRPAGPARPPRPRGGTRRRRGVRGEERALPGGDRRLGARAAGWGARSSGWAIGARICSPAPRPGTRSSTLSWAWTPTARSAGFGRA